MINKKRNFYYIYIFLFSASLFNSVTYAKTKNLDNLNQFAPSTNNDDNKNQKIEAVTESLITKSEENAIKSLESILKKSKGSPQEPDLWLRRAELYMRRAKSARFFEFQKIDSEAPLTIIPSEIKNQKSINHLSEANKSYKIVFTSFAKHPLADRALFGYAFNLDQMGDHKSSVKFYEKVILNYPRSSIVPDALISIAEHFYQNARFDQSLNTLLKMESHKNSANYWYSQYKKAWVMYNLHNNEQALEQLKLVIKNSQSQSNGFSLKEEALKDSVLFYYEAGPDKKPIPFFSEFIKNQEDLILSLTRLGDLYIRHSKYQKAQSLYEDILELKLDRATQVNILNKLVSLSLEQKNWDDAGEYLSKSSKTCIKNKIQTSFCEIDLPHLHAQLIKTEWAQFKKNNSDKKSSTRLEGLIKNAIQSALLTEKKKDFELLLGDFYFESKKFKQAAQTYYDSHKNYPGQKSLLAAIDSQTILASQSPDEQPFLIKLIDQFSEQYPTHEAVNNLKIKKVATLLQLNKLDECSKELEILMAPIKNKRAVSNKETIEDLYFDYLNKSENFSTLRDELKFAIDNSALPARQLELKKLFEQVSFKNTELNLSKSTELSKIKPELYNFIKLAAESEFLEASKKQDTLLYAIKKATDHKFFRLASINIITFIKSYPDHPKSLELAKFAFKHFISEGSLPEASLTSQWVALHTKNQNEKSEMLKSHIEIESVLGRPFKDLKPFLTSNMNQLESKQRSELFQFLLSLSLIYKDPAFNAWIENQIQELRIEPLSSEIVLSKAEQLLDQKKYEKVFEISKKYMSSQYPPEIRSKARWLQAKIFEKELREVGYKSNMNRIDLVLSIKTERLEKTQKAYWDVIKMLEKSNPTSPLILNSYYGIERCLGDYINYFEIFEIKNPSSSEQAKQLKTELKELTAPIQKQLKSVQSEIDKNKKTTLTSDAISIESHTWSDYTPDFTPLPVINPNSLNSFEFILPKDLDSPENIWIIPKPVKTCDGKDSSDIYQLMVCLTQAQSSAQASLYLDHLDGRLPLAGLTSYLLSQNELNQNNLIKAQYLIQISQSQDSNKLAAYFYQKGRIDFKNKLYSKGFSNLLKSYLMGLETNELASINVLEGYAQNNCYKSLAFADSLDKISDNQSRRHPLKDNLKLILSECYAKSLDTNKALAEIDKINEKSFSSYLQLGRLYEVYVQNKDQALNHYKKALAETDSSAFKSSLLDQSTANSAKNWLKEKINFLKTQVKSNSTDSKSEVPAGEPK